MIVDNLEKCLQLLIVTTPVPGAVRGNMTPFMRNSMGVWSQAMPTIPVVVGKNGMAWDEKALQNTGKIEFSRIKEEGDGCSPIGCFPLIQAFGSAEKTNLRMPYCNIQGLDGVDDPTSRYYNRLVRRNEVQDADWRSAERMEDYRLEYEWGVVVGYNWYVPKPKAGSCIFLHVWRSSSKGTAGCTAMEKETMQKITEWLDPAYFAHLIQCPQDVYEDLRLVEQLPHLRTP